MSSLATRKHLVSSMIPALVCAAIACDPAPPPPAPPPVRPAASAPLVVPPASPSADVAMATGPGTLKAGALEVGADEGRNTFTAVFDAPLGERITAQSSSVACQATYDEKGNTFSGSCSVPLTSIMVDNEPKKAEHFQQWATNKKIKPEDCRFEAKFDSVKVASSLQPGASARFETEVPFTICGRARIDGGREHLTGTIVLLPSDGSAEKTLRVRAEVAGFSRDRYHIGPAYTEGWLARVQKLAPVVSDQGTITLSLFASTK